MMEGVEVLNQVVIRTLGEKKTYKYVEILEADYIKQLEMKKKFFFKSQNNQTITRDRVL